MKTAAVIYCFIPWIEFALFRFVEYVGAASGTLSYLFLITWSLISPVFMAIGMFVAYTEGRRNG